MTNQNNRSLGSDKEELACFYLQQQGVTIVFRNFRCRYGEIDIVGELNGILIFFEVKYRNSTICGQAVQAVPLSKQKKICIVSDFYRIRYGVSARKQIRYDVIAIQQDHISWIQNAFPYCGNAIF